MPKGIYTRTEKQKENIRKALKGHFVSEIAKERMRNACRKRPTRGNQTEEMKEKVSGKKSYRWAGDNVGYTGLHKWVIKNLGQSTKCEQCNKDNLTGKNIDWANMDHKYKRNLENWIRLCKKCHKEYDKTKGFR